MSKVSVAIISRAEDNAALVRAVGSLEGYVDELAVADTGTDGLNVPFSGAAHVFEFPWADDFAAARNASFEACTEDWILWIDSDDVVTRPENVRKLVSECEKKGIDWVWSDYVYAKDEAGNVVTRHRKPRLVRAGTAKWQKRIHEDIVPTRQVVSIEDSELGLPIGVVHGADEGHMLESAERNLRLVEMMVREEKGEDPRSWELWGTTLMGLGRYGEALPKLVEYARRTKGTEYAYWALKGVANCLIHMGREEEAVNALLEAVKIRPDWATAYLDVARACRGQGKWRAALEWYRTGMAKSRPETLSATDDTEYGIQPLLGMAYCHLNLGEWSEAAETAGLLRRRFETTPEVDELLALTKEALELESRIENVLGTVAAVRKYDRQSASKILDLLPDELADDIRVQELRHLVVPPKAWPAKSVAIYCGTSLEQWSPASVYTGIGGSEEAVIYLSKELASLGYSVTVFNRCGDMKGEYDGVTYVPYYHWNPRDSFDTLIRWRGADIFEQPVQANRKYVWLHDIAYAQQFSSRQLEQVDKVLFLSEWHRGNLPDLPDAKAFVTNNGIVRSDFKAAGKKDGLIWSSSYDRGLLPFVKNVFPKILEEFPDKKLHVAYGWQNIDKELDAVPSLKALKAELGPILESHPNIVHHGRLSHRKLAELMSTMEVYPYATEFGETNNITSQKMQASGVYVVTTANSGGTPERVKYGTIVPVLDAYSSERSQSDFSSVVRASLKNRPKYDPKAADGFDWSVTAAQWAEELL